MNAAKEYLDEAATAMEGGRLRTAKSILEEGLRCFPQWRLVFTYQFGAWMRSYAGDGEAARKLFEAVLEHHDLGTPTGTAFPADSERTAAEVEARSNACENLTLLSPSYDEYEKWARRWQEIGGGPESVSQRAEVAARREKGAPWHQVLTFMAVENQQASLFANAASTFQLLVKYAKQMRVPREVRTAAVAGYAGCMAQQTLKCAALMRNRGGRPDPKEYKFLLVSAIDVVEDYLRSDPGDAKAQEALSGLRSFGADLEEVVPPAHMPAEDTPMPHDVFISYASEDRTVALAVCAKLESEAIRCWIAPRDILPGTNYGESIVAGINGGHLMLLVFSSKIHMSPHVPRELERAVSKGKIIIPFRIEDVDPKGGIEYYLSGVHWLDAVTPPLEQHIAKLATSVRTILDSVRPVSSLPRRTPQETALGTRSGAKVVSAVPRESSPASGPLRWQSSRELKTAVTANGLNGLAFRFMEAEVSAEEPCMALTFSPLGPVPPEKSHAAGLALRCVVGLTLSSVAARVEGLRSTSEPRSYRVKLGDGVTMPGVTIECGAHSQGPLVATSTEEGQEWYVQVRPMAIRIAPAEGPDVALTKLAAGFDLLKEHPVAFEA